MKIINWVIMMIATLFTRTTVVETKSELKAIIAERIEKYGPNCDLNDLRFPTVTDLSRLFHLSSFNGNISKWDVSHVTSMELMFTRSKFNGDISKWDVGNVVNMDSMFLHSQFNGDISKWDTSNVENMDFMFTSSMFSGDISEWNMDKVTSKKSMFAYTTLNDSVRLSNEMARWNIGYLRGSKWYK